VSEGGRDQTEGPKRRANEAEIFEEKGVGAEVEDREMEYSTIAAAIDACNSLTRPTWRVLLKP
jgi:hypothetical protein